jgi:hypothetical protein
MECSTILSLRRALPLFALLLCVSLGLASSRSVVLVVRADSPVSDLDSVTVRKLFLGVPVLIKGRPLHPLRNRSDARLDQIFLQEIAAMSQAAYEREILIGVNRQGWLRPEELGSPSRVLERVLSDPNAVSFMWLREVEHNPQIRVIRVLWTD